jgi:hypothetical protein
MHRSPWRLARRLALTGVIAAAAVPAAAQADITINVRDVNGAPVAGLSANQVYGQGTIAGSNALSIASDAAGTIVIPTASLAGLRGPYRIALGTIYSTCGQQESLTGIADGANVTTTPYGLGALLCGGYSGASTSVSFSLGAQTILRGDAGATASVQVVFPADAASGAQLSVNGAPISTPNSYAYAGLNAFDITMPAADGPIVATYLDSAGAPHSFTIGNVSIGGATPATLNAKLPRAFEFIIDNSGSMGGNDPTNQRFSAIQNLVQAGCIGNSDLVGAVGFDTSAYPIFTPIQPASGPTLGNFLTALKYGVVNSGGTDYNLAFGEAEAAFGSVAAVPTVQPIVFFLTDGDHNAGTYTNAHRFFGAYGRAPVYSIALGTSISSTGKALLNLISKQTGGEYKNPQSSEDLVASLSKLCNAATGGTTLKYLTYTFAKKNARHSLTVKLKKRTATRFQIAWGNGGKARFRLAVTGPDKVTHTLQKPGKGWKAKILGSTAQLVAAKPLKGKYTIVATAVKVAGSTQRGTALVTVGGR